MGPQRFRVVIAAGPRDSAVITMPFDPDEAWGAKADHPVGGTIGGCRIRTRLVPAGSGWVLTLTDAEQNRPQYADPISCPVLAVGAQAYLGDAVSKQLAQVASDVRGAVIPASGHNIALENPAALAQAYLHFFADR
jgi:pimeloyl-ACP methyl ester carboxylesterase